MRNADGRDAKVGRDRGVRGLIRGGKTGLGGVQSRVRHKSDLLQNRESERHR